MTLAMLVAVMAASTSRKLPKVNWPIESEIDRNLWTMAAKGIVVWTGSVQPALYAGMGRWGNIRRSPTGRRWPKGGPQPSAPTSNTSPS